MGAGFLQSSYLKHFMREISACSFIERGPQVGMMVIMRSIRGVVRLHTYPMQQLRELQAVNQGAVRVRCWKEDHPPCLLWCRSLGRSAAERALRTGIS
ncbi:hypothetical protein EJ110_NYTH54167 [Nymphaea thermarum]|nr:hypothetical protein EJ110_NYTH54167 [Nymphaea thermarum]